MISNIDNAFGPIANGASGAAQSNAAALPAVANKTNYLEGFDITGSGATAASVPRISSSSERSSAIPVPALPKVRPVGRFVRPVPLRLIRPIRWFRRAV